MTAAEVLALLMQLLTQGVSLLQMVQTAQANNVDITPDQLTQLRDAYAAAHAQVDALLKGS
jgi:hypothetical protein